MFFPTDKTDNKPTKILKDVEESANLIDTDDFYPSFRPSIDCDVLNSVIVEENDEDMQSLNSSIATSNDFEKSRQIDARIELSPKILSNRPMFSSEAGVLEDSAVAQPNRDISVGGQDKFQQISQANIQSPADKEILEIEKTKTTDQLINHSTPNNFASDEINVDSRQNRKKFSVSSRCVSVDDNVGKETDVDDDDDDEDDLENDDQDQSCSNLSELVQTGPMPSLETNVKGLYHSTLVTTCVDDDSDTEEEEPFENYDLKVPNESWTDFKSSHNRPAPVGCSSDSPSAASSETSSGPEKDHYDSLEDDTDSPLVSVSSMTPKGHPMGAQKVGGQPLPVSSNLSSTNSVGHGKRSLPSIPQDHSLQQIRAYEILRQQWQKQYDDSIENNQDQSCSNLSEFVQTGPNWSQSREVRPRCIEGQEISEKFKEPTLNSKRQLPKPPPLSPLVFNNDSGVASLEEKCSGSENISAALPTTVTQRQFDEKKRSSGNGNSSVVSVVAAAPSVGAPPQQQQNNFLWVGLEEESGVQRRPKNHNRLSSLSKKRHSAPPGSLDEFQNSSQIANSAKKSSVSSGHGHVSSKKSLQNNKSGIYAFVFNTDCGRPMKHFFH